MTTLALRRTDRPWRLACLVLLGLLAALPGEADEGALPAPPPTFPPLQTEVMVPRLDVISGEAPAPEQAIEAVAMPEEEAASSGDDDSASPVAPETEQADIEPVPTVAVAAPEPLAPPPLKRLEIMLDWYPSPRHAPLILARDNGVLPRNGLEIVLSTPADPSVPTRLLAAGRVDLAVTRQPLLHLQVDRGLPLIRVATLVGLPLAAVILRDGQGEASLARLAGKRVGYADEDGRDILLPALLKPHGLVPAELTLTDVNFGLAAAMVDDEVDGLIVSSRLQLPRQLADEGASAQLLRVEEHGIPLHDGLILVANRDRLGGQKEAIRKLIAALEETTAWMIEFPDEAWRRLIASEPSIDTPANRAAWPEILRRFSTRPAAMDSQRYAGFERFLYERGLVGEETPVDRLGVDPGAP
ncbi:ABC transporter substrate-binding protein [Halomonas sp. 3H]|uniref:ABC transporter substrate-binding protein n=1 Tax=Halomonas sp. 3H TaxID=2952527 RepID=UPI0020B8766C|nr:ABC transporter substrate-binding protein [Halomonas sp. 3H]